MAPTYSRLNSRCTHYWDRFYWVVSPTSFCQAALRASRVDLGPRGISQVAKIMATGDPNLGRDLETYPLKSSNKKLVETSALLVVTSALLVVTRS